MRKLASIQRVTEISPIEGADRIEVATIMGWKIVIKKDQFSVGDPCVYCEIDSVLPPRPEFEFMRPRGFRVKTAKLRGQISQGLCFPVDVLAAEHRDVAVGTDVTELLGITKFIPKSVGMSGSIIGALPGYCPKTDEPRIQSNIELLQEMKGISCYITTKIDGKSGTFINRDGEILCCSRNNAFRDEPGDHHWMAARRYNVTEKLLDVGNYAVQGEIAGPGIQKNRLQLSEIDFFCFNVYDINASRYLDFTDFVEFCERLEIQTVPVDTEEVVFDFTLDQLLEMARGRYRSGRHREGIVIRPRVGQTSKALGGARMSLKVINNDFLLKE